MNPQTTSGASGKYLFNSLKTYASPEWLAEGKKDYRRVFESGETTFVFAELSFYNKFFCKGDWTAHIQFKCYRLNSEAKEQLCDIRVEEQISQEQHIVFIREGWGHKESGFFWKSGDYLWEAHIEGQPVGAHRFYVEDSGPAMFNFNPYFDLTSIRLFEGSSEGVDSFDRLYLRHFSTDVSRFVWVELTFENMVAHAWFCEIIFNFKNSSGQLKGQTTELRQIQSEDDEVVIVTGLGADEPGTWFHDKYTIEIIFMGQLIAVVHFDCGDYQVEGLANVLTGLDHYLRVEEEGADEVEREPMESILSRLQELVGMEDVKKKIFDYIEYLEFLKLRKEKGFDEGSPISLHSVFKGNPGTGKTTVAKLMGKVYHKLGFLTKGGVLEVGRAELIGQYIGQTAPKVKEVIEAARGGVLFIDEAYALVRNEDDEKDYGHEVIEVLVKEMSDGPGNIAIFVAGYPKGMETFLRSNPGFKSRFRTFFHFPDYTPQELWQIADLALRKKEVKATKEAKNRLQKKLTEYYRDRDENFGNARLVYSLVEEAKMEMGLRIMRSKNREALPDRALATIKLADVENIFWKREAARPQLAIDHQLLGSSLAQLDQMVGLEQVKADIHELTTLVKFYLETGRDALGKFSLHTVFKGNPGTGKTTIARLLAQIFKALGILERGHLVECSREMLVAGYVGQTAIKTKAVIDKAKGGVLFIDEAYALEGGTNDFGKESIEVLLKEMEDHRGAFAIVAAGYTKPMERFLEANPGLKSRFDRELLFEDLNEAELMAVSCQMLEKEGLTFSPEAQGHFADFLSFAYRHRDNYFGNAREVRKWVEKMVRNQHLRLAKLPARKRSRPVLKTLYQADVAEFHSGNPKYMGTAGLGFRTK